MEKRILIKHISELKTGMRMIVIPNCGKHKEHRYMVMNPVFGRNYPMMDNNIPDSNGYEVIPNPGCKGPGKVTTYQYDLDCKPHYKLIDDTEESISNTKELELVK